MGIAGGWVESGFKIQTIGKFPSLHGPKHIPCFGYLKKTKPHTIWPNFLIRKNKTTIYSERWSSLIYKLCFPCFSFHPGFVVRPSGADGIMSTVGNIEKLPVSWRFGTFSARHWVEWLAPQETHAPPCTTRGVTEKMHVTSTEILSPPATKTFNKQLSTGVT